MQWQCYSAGRGPGRPAAGRLLALLACFGQSARSAGQSGRPVSQFKAALHMANDCWPARPGSHGRCSRPRPPCFRAGRHGSAVYIYPHNAMYRQAAWLAVQASKQPNAWPWGRTHSTARSAWLAQEDRYYIGPG